MLEVTSISSHTHFKKFIPLQTKFKNFSHFPYKSVKLTVVLCDSVWQVPLPLLLRLPLVPFRIVWGCRHLNTRLQSKSKSPCPIGGQWRWLCRPYQCSGLVNFHQLLKEKSMLVEGLTLKRETDYYDIKRSVRKKFNSTENPQNANVSLR